jgi:hypothetical protein
MWKIYDCIQLPSLDERVAHTKSPTGRLTYRVMSVHLVLYLQLFRESNMYAVALYLITKKKRIGEPARFICASGVAGEIDNWGAGTPSITSTGVTVWGCGVAWIRSYRGTVLRAR